MSILCVSHFYQHFISFFFFFLYLIISHETVIQQLLTVNGKPHEYHIIWLYGIMVGFQIKCDNIHMYWLSLIK